MKYYAEKYNRTIKDPKQPLLISIAKVVSSIYISDVDIPTGVFLNIFCLFALPVSF